jgi:phosphoglycerol transferase MdoB-like AlkP superfamily enzyme
MQDDKILNFIESFFKKGYFDDTLFLILSDHGNNFGSYYSLFETVAEDRRIEGLLPVFIVIIPNKEIIYKSGLYNNLMENQQTFISPYDVYNSIIHASCSDYKDIDTKPKNQFERGGIYSWRGYTIFNLIDYKGRYCSNPDLDLMPFRCICKK